MSAQDRRLCRARGIRFFRNGAAQQSVHRFVFGERHALKARADSAVLVTLLLRGGDAGSQGGAGHRREPGKDSPTKA